MGRIVALYNWPKTATIYDFPAGKTTALRGEVDWTTAFAQDSASRYEYDEYGLSPAPITTEPEWDYLIRADYDLSGAVAQANVVAKYHVMLRAFAESYMVSSNTYTGNKGWLRVYLDATEAAGTLYEAQARILKCPYQTAPGRNVYGLSVTLGFKILSDWNVVTDSDDTWGTFLWGVSEWG